MKKNKKRTPLEETPAKWQAHGLTCYVRKGPHSLNGYVAVKPTHPWYKLHYHECPRKCHEEWCSHTPESVIDVHGGLTYSALGEDGWVFGFDTAHAEDYVDFGIPGFPYIAETNGRHWEVEDVADEVEKLAKQLSYV